MKTTSSKPFSNSQTFNEVLEKPTIIMKKNISQLFLTFIFTLLLGHGVAHAGLFSETPTEKNAVLQNIIQGELTRKSSGLNSTALSQHIAAVSSDYNIDPLLVLSIIKTESSFNPKAKSGVGAIGLMQVMPIVVKDAGHAANVHTNQELWNPTQNVKLGTHYFSKLMKRYNNNLRNALTAYNMGPTALNRLLKKKASFNTSYYQKVMKNYSSMRVKSAVLKTVL
jgi:soluble lytic murein transglycosylase-like protein